MNHDVLTADEAATLLGVSAWTVRDQARQGRLPGRKVGKEWRFYRRAILQWLGAITEAETSVIDPAHQVPEPPVPLDRSDRWPKEAIREDGSVDCLAVALAYAEPLAPDFSSVEPHRLAARGDGWFVGE